MTTATQAPATATATVAAPAAAPAKPLLARQPADETPMAQAMPIVLKLSPAITMTKQQFALFCAINSDLRIERTAEGHIEVMPPAFSYTGAQNADITIDLGIWARQDGTGRYFGPTAGFTLPNRAVRAPDASWIANSRLESLPPDELTTEFAHICPDFVIELRSSSDRLSVIRAKMDEYIANGARLGWLIDPRNRQVHIYRPEAEPQILDAPESVSGDPELPGFVLNLKPIWDAAP